MERETLAVLRSCRDHWKTSFEHERATVVAVRKKLEKAHRWMAGRMKLTTRDGKCGCRDCRLVREARQKPAAPR